MRRVRNLTCFFAASHRYVGGRVLIEVIAAEVAIILFAPQLLAVLFEPMEPHELVEDLTGCQL